MAKAILELEMPQSCRECPFYKITDICDILSAWNNYMPVLVPSEGKHPDCPLKEVEEDEFDRAFATYYETQGLSAEEEVE